MHNQSFLRSNHALATNPVPSCENHYGTSVYSVFKWLADFSPTQEPAIPARSQIALEQQMLLARELMITLIYCLRKNVNQVEDLDLIPLKIAESLHEEIDLFQLK